MHAVSRRSAIKSLAALCGAVTLGGINLSAPGLTLAAAPKTGPAPKITAHSQTSPAGLGPTTPSTGGTIKITGARQIAAGGMMDASLAGKPMVYSAWDSGKIYHLHTINADGSNDRLLTTNPGHACNPVWHPSGEWIVYTSEIPGNALQVIKSDGASSEWFVNGLWMNLCAYHVPDGKLYTLVTYSLNTDGAMGPHFSPDGTKLAWSRITGNPDSQHKFGYYRMIVADWTVDGGTPSVRNLRDITPAGMAFVEVSALSNDTLLFSSDVGAGDLWKCGLDGSNPVNLTPNAQYWCEHAIFTPSGDMLYMGPGWGEIGRTELNVMRQPLAPGAASYQLTHFGVPGSAEYVADLCMPTLSSFVAGAEKLAIDVQMVATYPERRLWVLDYQMT